MAARVELWMLILLMLVGIQISMARRERHCWRIGRCYICRYPWPMKKNCLVLRYCLNRHHEFEKPVCLKYKPIEVKRPCGIHPTRDIVGGSQTNEGDWPWQVSLQKRYYGHICGGVLIDTRWVLTAGHCVEKAKIDDMIVVLGMYDLNKNSPNEEFRHVKKIFVHPRFHSGGNYPNDVALILLKKDVEYTEYISPVCLPTLNDHYPSNSCSITGWGETRGTGDKSRLRVLKVTVLPPGKCEKYWYGNIIPKIHLCVNYGLKGACSGDSGGPLSCVRSSDGRHVVAGVTSWGAVSCHTFGYPSIYTNIRTFVPWINYIMRSN